LHTDPPIEKLPISTAILSHVVLALFLWNCAVRLALLIGTWVTAASL
jgi:hypothetical protein